jgi:hypothetical protein
MNIGRLVWFLGFGIIYSNVWASKSILKYNIFAFAVVFAIQEMFSQCKIQRWQHVWLVTMSLVL